MSTLIRNETFMGQTVKMEDLNNGFFSVTSFGELGYKCLVKSKIETASHEYGAIKLNITNYYLGRERHAD